MIKIVALFFLLFFVNLGHVKAHFHEISNGMKATIHLDPDDNPIAGTKSGVHINIDDSEQKFDLGKCECEVVIYKNDKIVGSTNLFEPSGIYEINFKQVFPSKGVYEIKVKGKPKIDNYFKSFEFLFNVRVEKEITGIDRLIYQISDFREEILFGIVALTFALVAIIKRMERN